MFLVGHAANCTPLSPPSSSTCKFANSANERSNKRASLSPPSPSLGRDMTSRPPVDVPPNTPIARPRPKPMQLPIVEISSLADAAATTAVTAAAVATSAHSLGTASSAQKELPTPMFVDTSSGGCGALESPAAFRLLSGGATSAMLHERYFGYRHERNSSSSSDSGLAFPFSPPAAALGKPKAKSASA